MKKIISFVINSLVILSALIGIYISTNEVRAQNIGSLQSIVTPGFSFKKDLRIGDTDPDIIQLQKVLNADVDTRIITDGPGARGKETSYFGELTKAAVIKFQNKYKNIVLSLNNITVADGLVNKATRTRLNLLIGVIDTYDSVGQPQSRAGTTPSVTTSTYVAPTTIVTQSQPQMTSCQLIELLINIDVIASNKVSAARSAFSCLGASAQPFVDIKVNGQDGPLTLSLPRNVTVSWTSSGVTACQSGNSITKPVFGSETVTVRTNGVFEINCTGPAGFVSDSVIVEDIENEDESNLIVSVTAQASTSTATFFITTNKEATHKIYYGTTVNTVSSVTISGRNTQSTRQLTNLLANTRYYFKVLVTDSSGNTAESSIGNFTTAGVQPLVVTPTSTSTGAQPSATVATSSPLILASYVIPSYDSAVFYIITDRPVTARIDYGISGQSTTSANVTSPTTYIQKNVSGLVEDTTYRYRVFVTDLNGGTASTTEKTFTTLQDFANLITTPTTPPLTSAKYSVSFGGYVESIEACPDDSNNYHLVIIRPCSGSTNIVGDVLTTPGTETDTSTITASDYNISAGGSLTALFYPGYGDPLPKRFDSVLGVADANYEAKCQTASMKASGKEVESLGKSIGVIKEVGSGPGLSCILGPNFGTGTSASGGSLTGGTGSLSGGGFYESIGTLAGSGLGALGGSAYGTTGIIFGGIGGGIIGGAVGGFVDDIGGEVGGFLDDASHGFGLW